MDRRKFLKIAGLTSLGAATAAGVYPFLEAKWCRVARQDDQAAEPASHLPRHDRWRLSLMFITGRSCRSPTSAIS